MDRKEFRRYLTLNVRINKTILKLVTHYLFVAYLTSDELLIGRLLEIRKNPMNDIDSKNGKWRCIVLFLIHGRTLLIFNSKSSKPKVKYCPL